jgi:sugar O-acyltransferase (sialic acid O-acetyltransferase NeuD family)
MDKPSRSLVVLGAGGHAKVIIAAIEALGWRIAGVFDDDSSLWNTHVLGHPVVGSVAQAAENQQRDAVIAIGDNRIRRRIAETLQFNWPTIIHPCTWVAPSASIGAGTVLFAGAIVQPDVKLGEHCIVNTLAGVDHDCIVSDYVHLCPGVKLAGGVAIEQGVMVGTGAVVLPNKRIGSWSIVGAGAVVNRDFDAYSTVVGVPARLSSSKE